MIREVCDRVLICGHLIVDFDTVIWSQGVTDCNLCISRVILVSVRAEQGECDLCAKPRLLHLCIPETVAVIIRSAVQVVLRAGIDHKCIRHSIEGKSCSADAVCISSHNLTKMTTLVQTGIHAVIA